MSQQHTPLNRYSRIRVTREGFLSLFVASFGAVAGLAVGLPIIGYVLGPVIGQPKKVWRDTRLVAADGTPGELVGVNTIPHGQNQKVVFENAGPKPWAGATARSASWLRQSGPQEFIAFSINCTHLGCPVIWVGGGNIFLCPCHGSVFNGDGTLSSGPAARPLTRYPVRVKRGRVQILTEPLPVVYIGAGVVSRTVLHDHLGLLSQVDLIAGPALALALVPPAHLGIDHREEAISPLILGVILYALFEASILISRLLGK